MQTFFVLRSSSASNDVLFGIAGCFLTFCESEFVN